MKTKRIIITGSNSRFAKSLKKQFIGKNIFYTDRKKLNILDINSIEKNFRKFKPKILIHIAGLSRPMNIHDKNIYESIDKNIIGTCNIVKVCKKYNVKLIYFSTNYVYPGTKGKYKETDPLLPINNYAWSKLGGECAVQMYKNSLILRLCVTEKPFTHKVAFHDAISSFMFHEDLLPHFNKVINKKGIINVGGDRMTVYKFAKKNNPKVEGISRKNTTFPKDSSIDLKKFRKIKKT